MNIQVCGKLHALGVVRSTVATYAKGNRTMPTHPPHFCSVSGCYEIVEYGKARCPKHATEKHRRINKNRKPPGVKFYSSPKWRRLRAYKLSISPFCEICNQIATDVDHIVPRSKGGTDSLRNLQSLCHSCHSRKTMKELNEKMRRG